MTRLAAFGCLVFLSACAPPGDRSDAMLGYGEARYVYLAAEESGRIGATLAREGDAVVRGQTIFRLDPVRLTLNADAARAQAAASASRAERTGALDEAVAQAAAQARLADLALARSRTLFAGGHVAQARLDADAAAAEAARAALARAQAERKSARLESGGLESSLKLAERRIADLDVPAPTAGIVDRIYRRPGEVVAAGEPLAALIAPDGMRVRFFAPQVRLASLPPGAKVALSCDGCRKELTGRISFVATEPEFTPPIIYSREERDRLVFLVEAIPDDPTAIRPGLPVEVRAMPARAP